MKKQLLTFLSLLITGIISAQVGIGTTDPKSSLEIQGSLGYKVNTITSATTLDDTFNVILCNNGPYTVTLPPAAANASRVYRIKNIDLQGDVITIDPNGSETIEGDLTYALQPYKHSITIISDGANWHVIENLYLGGAVVGTISTLTCGSATDNGTLVSGIAASSVSSEIPYSGGNSGTHDGDTVASTGVTGLTANLSSGVFASSGSLTYTITGTPASSGTATFALNIGGQTCNLTRTVNPGLVTALTCGSATDNGTLVHGVAASGVNSVVPYTGGNAGPHSGQTVNSTGVTGLTATLTAGNFADGSGNLTYTITGTPASSGTATFALNIGGQTCNLTRTVNPGLITALTCGSATNNGYLTSGQAASGVSSVIPYTGGNAGPHSGQTVASTGITGLTATLTAGTFASGSGNLTYTITGTPSGAGTATFALNIGGQTCNLTRTTYAVGTITGLTCGSATNNGTLEANISASGITSEIPYTGGNGGAHSGQTVNSTGVTGLTATIAAGIFANGNGSLTYTITGTPTSSGTATFALNIGGRTCNLTRTVFCNTQDVSFTYNGANVTYGVVRSSTGKCWLDRNLGASQVAASSTDHLAYGDLFQWGRGADGHQLITWTNSTTGTAVNGTTTTKSATDTPGHGDFIFDNTDYIWWRTSINYDLWQGVNGINNPCPTGWRLPTNTELNAELSALSITNTSTAASSLLKLPATGFRNIGSELSSTGTAGRYYTSTLYFGKPNILVIDGSSAVFAAPSQHVYGIPVRCIKD
jgi:hypothetical protein